LGLALYAEPGSDCLKRRWFAGKLDALTHLAGGLPFDDENGLWRLMGEAFAHGDEVRVEQKEEDQGDRQKVHIEAEQDATVVEAPAFAHTTDCVGGADDAEQQRQGEERVAAEVGKTRHGGSDGQAEEDDGVAPGEGTEARVEGGWGPGG
jgi:hypothetical protein